MRNYAKFNGWVEFLAWKISQSRHNRGSQLENLLLAQSWLRNSGENFNMCLFEFVRDTEFCAYSPGSRLSPIDDFMGAWVKNLEGRFPAKKSGAAFYFTTLSKHVGQERQIFFDHLFLNNLNDFSINLVSFCSFSDTFDERILDESLIRRPKTLYVIDIESWRLHSRNSIYNLLSKLEEHKLYYRIDPVVLVNKCVPRAEITSYWPDMLEFNPLGVAHAAKIDLILN